jgi:hypothetical protein
VKKDGIYIDMKKINGKRIMTVGREVLLGWEAEASDLSLGGLDLEKMKLLEDAARVSVDKLAELRNAEKAAMAECDGAQTVYWEALKRARYGCLSHPKFGGNSGLYARWGYVRDDKKRSGLSRKPKSYDGEDAPEG